MTPRASWAGPTLVGLLALTLVFLPQPAAAEGEKAKQVEAIKKQMAELQKQLAELEKGDAPDKKPAAAEPLPDAVSKHFAWRNVGPANMGGRVTSLAVVESEPTTYYVGTGTGGLLKTVNNGTTFDVLFGGQSTVSIGDVGGLSVRPQYRLGRHRRGQPAQLGLLRRRRLQVDRRGEDVRQNGAG